MESSFLEIKDIKIWARVGVLMEERKFGQLFSWMYPFGMILVNVQKQMI